jgi:hypothetical protein
VSGQDQAFQNVLKLTPVETRARVGAEFHRWCSVLAADQRFKGKRNKLPAADPEPAAGGGVAAAFEWRAILQPKGVQGTLDVRIKLIDKSVSYSPLDRNYQGAIGRDAEGGLYVLRQWYDTKRLGSRALTAEDLERYGASPWVELEHAPSKGNAGRNRLYFILAKLTGSPDGIAQQTVEAIEAFHRVADITREEL